MSDAYLSEVRSLLAEQSEGIQRYAETRLGDVTAGASAPFGGTSPREGLAQKMLADPTLADWQRHGGRLATRVGVQFDPSVEIKSTTTNSSPTGGTLAQADRVPGIIETATRRRWVWESGFTLGQATSHTVEFLRESGAVRVAGTQLGEGALKPASTFTYEVELARVLQFAHLTKASRQAMGDQPALDSFLRTRLLHGLWRAVERQILVGVPSAPAFAGVAHADNHTVYVGQAGLSAIDQIRRAIALLQNADYAPGLLILNPLDWGTIETARTDGSGELDLGDPARSAAPVLWGIPVHASPDWPQGKFCLADPAALHLWTRSDGQILVSDSDGDDFQRNILTLLGECRMAFAAVRPEAVLVGDLVTAAA